MNDQDLLEHVGSALFGPSWHGSLAKALVVSDRTLRRWVNGEFAVPAGVWVDLRKLCLARASLLRRIAGRTLVPKFKAAAGG